MSRRIVPVLLTLSLGFSGLVRAADENLNAREEQAMKAAVLKVAPSVVQIESTGGSDIIGTGPGGIQVRKGVGPTTGLAVSVDGYVVSSAFNFANKPTSIFVSVPGHKQRYLAKVVATDQTRMVTLLKTEAMGLAVPTPAPKKQVRVGQWSLALGRTLDPDLSHPPSVSVGIISAVDRIWGKAVQTDAKVSPVNYGGPLIDIGGRVIGVLVPASPRGEGETAGREWYDGGIGFAIPLEDVNAVLPRLKEGKDLKRGLLGVTLQSPDIYSASPVIGSVAPDSAAAKAGIKPGDTVVEIDDKPVVRQAQIMHLLGNKYEGDTASVKIRRGKEEIALPNLKLTGAVSAFTHPFLGILPIRDDPEPGVEVRFVFPKSPAEAAGVKAGDRVMKIAPASAKELRAFSGRDELTALLNALTPGTEVKVEIRRPAGLKKTETLTVQLAPMSAAVLDKLPEYCTLKQALAPRKPAAGQKPRIVPRRPRDDGKKEDNPEEKKGEKKAEKPEEKKEEAKKPETGLLKRTNAARDREYWVYVPENYNPNIAHALVVWLHPVGRGGKDADDMVDLWGDYCEENRIILVGPRAENPTGWLPSDGEFIQQAAREVMGQYTVDKQRVVVHGMGVGGQMAYYLGLQARDLFRGVATTGAVFTRQPRDNVADQRLAFFIVAGAKDPLAKDIEAGQKKLAEHKFPVTYREIPTMGSQYLGQDTLEELVRWIDSLDRM